MRQLAAIAVLVVGSFHGTTRQALPAATGAGTETPATAADRHDIRAIAFSPDGKLLLTPGDDGLAVLTDAQTGRAVRRLEGHRSGINAVAFSPDGRRIATGGGVLFHSDEVIRLWDSSSGQLVQRFAGHRSPVSSLAFSPDGRQVLSGGAYDDSARLWDVTSGQELRRFGPQTGGINAVAFSADGKWLVTGGHVTGRDEGRFNPFNVLVWDTGSAEKKQQIGARGNRVTCLAVSAPAKRAAVGLDSGHVELYDGQTWEWQIGVSHVEPREDISRVQNPDYWYAAREAIRALAFAPDGKRLLTGSDDKTARLWDVGQRVELRRLAHPGAVRAVAFSPDGKRLATATGATVIAWDASTGKELFRAEQPAAGNAP